ncbi:MAG TPA: OmpA family protein [Bacteroidales bacterium]|nr:OmpA family protein [Bacteroidales bacterium]
MKKNIAKTILILAIIGMHFNLFGQGKYVLMGNKAYENKQYTSAIEYYTKALDKFDGEKLERNEVVFKLADCFRIINNPRKAEVNYQRLVKNKYAEEKPVVYLYYAITLSSQGKYTDALSMFNQYLTRVPGDPLAITGKASCELSLRDTTTETQWFIKNVREINSQDDDFAAVYGDNKFKTVIFTSNRKGATGKEIDNWTDGYFSDLFISTKKKGDIWGMPVLADNNQMVNTSANEGAASLDNQYKELYFTRCGKMHKGKEYCQILEVSRMGNGWGRPIVIYTDSLSNAGHPAITANGLTMIFASNRPGGNGGKDLWKTTRPSKRKSFGHAENLGSIINTSGDELFPSFYNDTILYFASNGRAGYGGLDIYRVTLGKNGPSNVEHLPRPINSYADDFAISFEGNKEKGFFTSRRTGGKGGDDIWYFEKINRKISVQGLVMDEVTQQPMQRLLVNVIDSENDTTTVFTDDKGTFLLSKGQIKEENNYTLIVSKENYFTKKTEVAIGKLKNDTIFHVNFALQPIPEKPIVLPDIYYELNKWDLLPQYQDSLMLLVNVLDDNPKIIIELSSHTDSRASMEYNDELSQKRAETVVKFLTEKGINKARLVAKGYGERMPRVLTTDITKDGYTFERGTKLTEEYILSISDVKKKEVAYQLNRRTEFLVIGKNYK